MPPKGKKGGAPTAAGLSGNGDIRAALPNVAFQSGDGHEPSLKLQAAQRDYQAFTKPGRQQQFFCPKSSEGLDHLTVLLTARKAYIALPTVATTLKEPSIITVCNYLENACSQPVLGDSKFSLYARVLRIALLREANYMWGRQEQIRLGSVPPFGDKWSSLPVDSDWQDPADELIDPEAGLDFEKMVRATNQPMF